MPKKKPTRLCPPPKPSYDHSCSRFSVEIKPSTIRGAGLGLFALEPIPSGVVVGEYTGDTAPFAIPGGYTVEVELDSYYIDAYNYPRCVMAMINDPKGSDNRKNVEFEIDRESKRVWIVSLRSIEKGEELFLDYGPWYWK